MAYVYWDRRFGRANTFLRNETSSTLSGSPRILAQLAFKGVYWDNLGH